METALSEEQALLRDSLRDFLVREVTFDRVRELERETRHDDRLWTRLAELGWLGLPFPARFGGGDGNIVDLAIATEELARTAAMVPFAEVMAAGIALARAFPADIAAGELEAIQSGGSIVLPAVLDQSDSYEHPAGKGSLSSGVSGRRCFVDYAPVATAFLARVDDGLALIRRDASGVGIEPLRGIARLPVAHVDFDDAPATRAEAADSYGLLLQLMRILSAVQCLGYAQVAADMATEYVKNRVQFGRPLGSFQAVQHHCANMALMNQATRFLVYEAAWALDAGTASMTQVATAKAWASKAAIEVTAISHQLHGGIGVTEEYDLHFFSRRAKDRAVAWGTPDECLDIVAPDVAAPVDWS